MDPDALAIVWKAERDSFGTHTSVPGRSRLASENSEDALSWNLFRTLEKAGQLDAVTRALGLEDDFQALYWYRPWYTAEPLPEISAALEQVEPGQGYHTETNIMLKGQRYLVMVEGRLGKPGAQIRPWERIGSSSVPVTYKAPLRDLLVDMSVWEKTTYRFYQLLRHLVLAHELCRAEVWGLEPHLLAIVNDLNQPADYRSHAEELAYFRRFLHLPAGRTHLLTWQTLLARAKATFDPAFRPLLDHTARLSYLRRRE